MGPSRNTQKPSLFILTQDTMTKFVTINEYHKTFGQEVTINEKLCKNIAFKLQATYVLDIC